MSNDNFSTTLWGQTLKSLEPKIKSVLDKNTISLCKAEYNYDLKEMKIFAVNDFAYKVLKKYMNDINKIVDDIMLSENTIEIKKQDNNNITYKTVKHHSNTTRIDGIINKRFKFENFIIDDENTFPYNVALSVANTLGSYNPLIIFSNNPGLGKTHLLHAIANYIKKYNKAKTITITSGKTFLREYIAGIQNKTYEKLKQRYLKSDIILIDDLDDLSSKTKTQEEFLGIAEEFLRNNKQLVITMSQHPMNLKNFNPSLKDMLSSGTVAEISSIGYMLAKRIMQHKFLEENFSIEEKYVDIILELLDFSSIREIDGAVKSVIAFFSLSQKQLNNTNIQTLFSSLRNRKKTGREQKLLDIISSYYGIEIDKLTGNTRSKNISHARSIAMYILRKELNIKLKDIAELFSKKSHATVIHAIDNISKLLNKDQSLLIDINNIKRRIKS